MSDIALNFVDDTLDFEIKDGDLVLDDGLETAVLISLFSDRRVEQEELPTLENDRRGYWGDLFSDFDGDQMGSKRWLLERAKISQEIRARVEEIDRSALNWLIEDGIAEQVSVVAEISNSNRIDSRIQILKPTGTETNFEFIWEGQEIKRG